MINQQPAAAPDRAVYTVAEVARLLSLSRGMAYAMVRSGDIPAKKLGDRWIVPKVRFHEWLAECNGAPTPAQSMPGTASRRSA